MKRIIKEARKMYDNLPKLIAKDFSIDDIIEMANGGKPGRRQEAAQATTMPEEINFSDLLGAGQMSASAEQQALESNGTQAPSTDFPSLEPGMESLLEASPREDGSLLG
jgi:hypothetical protein